jgi:VCBS repeat-containing protein
MWKKGTISIPETGEIYSYCAKVYDVGSMYGINEGRISKLEIRKDGKWLFNYDRGDDINELDEGGKKAYQIILQKYDGGQEA